MLFLGIYLSLPRRESRTRVKFRTLTIPLPCPPFPPLPPLIPPSLTLWLPFPLPLHFHQRLVDPKAAHGAHFRLHSTSCWCNWMAHPVSSCGKTTKIHSYPQSTPYSCAWLPTECISADNPCVHRGILQEGLYAAMSTRN